MSKIGWSILWSNAKRSSAVFDLPEIQERISALDKKTLDPHFWSDPKQAEAQIKEGQTLRRSIERYSLFSELLNDAQTLVELEAAPEELENALLIAERQLASAQEQIMFSGPNDALPALLEINSGAGGLESEDFVYMLFRMYYMWGTSLGMKVELSYLQEGEGGGTKSCSLSFQGDRAYGRLRSEIGVHRLVRVSPFDKRSRTHTSFASVAVVPIIDDTIHIGIKESDVEWDFFRSSGAGGQSVNKTESAVRITHKPSGLIITCQQAREQRENRDIALKMLRSKLYDLELQKRRDQAEEQRSASDEPSFGSQIRSYVLSGARAVRDHRTSIVLTNVDDVMNGDIKPLIKSFLLAGKPSPAREAR